MEHKYNTGGTRGVQNTFGVPERSEGYPCSHLPAERLRR